MQFIQIVKTQNKTPLYIQINGEFHLGVGIIADRNAFVLNECRVFFFFIVLLI